MPVPNFADGSVALPRSDTKVGRVRNKGETFSLQSNGGQGKLGRLALDMAVSGPTCAPIAFAPGSAELDRAGKRYADDVGDSRQPTGRDLAVDVGNELPSPKDALLR